MRGRRAHRQRGAALILLATILVLGSLWLVTRGLAFGSSSIVLENAGANGAVLRTAHAALIGHVARQAGDTSNPNPGRLPCPEPLNAHGTAAEGVAATSCTLPAAGRLPWRTLGLGDLRDATGERLWYVVGPGWANPSAGTIQINSNSPGQLTLDGVAAAAAALIIAPGRAFNTIAGAGCAARSQTRPAPGVIATLDLRDYLECENATVPADAVFVSRGATASFNDQALAVTADEVIRSIEGSVARRIALQVAPRFATVYANVSRWTGTGPTDIVFPFAAAFANPGTSAYIGSAGLTEGLPPVSYTQGCTPGPADPRCQPAMHPWRSGSFSLSRLSGSPNIHAWSCALQGDGTIVRCTLWVDSSSNTLRIQVNGRIENVGDAFRDLETSLAGLSMPGLQTSGRTLVTPVPLAADGSALVSVQGTVSNTSGPPYNPSFVFCFPHAMFCFQRAVDLPTSMIIDHNAVNPNDPDVGWFYRNRWHEVSYYAVSPAHTPGTAAGRNCVGAGTCLSTTDENGTTTANRQALIVFAGRGLTPAARALRPDGALGNFLEDTNADGDRMFAEHRWSPAFNDRLAVISP